MSMKGHPAISRIHAHKRQVTRYRQHLDLLASRYRVGFAMPWSTLGSPGLHVHGDELQNCYAALLNGPQQRVDAGKCSARPPQSQTNHVPEVPGLAGTSGTARAHTSKQQWHQRGRASRPAQLPGYRRDRRRPAGLLRSLRRRDSDPSCNRAWVVFRLSITHQE